MLEQATADGDHPVADLDPQTAQLRKAWMAFGQLLETAGPAAEESLAWLAMPPATRRHRGLVAMLGALAVALLIAVGTTWMWRTAFRSASSGSPLQPAAAALAKGSAAPAFSKGSPVAVVPETAAAPVVGRRSASSGKGQAVVPTTSEAPWDDPLDAQFVEVGQDVVRVQESWSARPRSLDLVWYAVEQAQQEVEKGAL
jgi:hypothetical protein